MKPSTKTGQITAKAFELLEQHPDGMRWVDLRSEIEASEPTFHPKTVNGIVWQLSQKYPDRVYKPAKGVFRLIKYRNNKKGE
jgi:hypothetical protein